MPNKFTAPKTWYVYTYAYPDGTVFFVGKGIGARINSHEREAQSKCSCKRCCIIRQIWESGQPIQKRIVYETLKEHEALRHEYLLIKTYGLTNLTNVKEGTSYRTARLVIGATRVFRADFFISLCSLPHPLDKPSKTIHNPIVYFCTYLGLRSRWRVARCNFVREASKFEKIVWEDKG